MWFSSGLEKKRTRFDGDVEHSRSPGVVAAVVDQAVVEE
jgi:hypothetical protein